MAVVPCFGCTRWDGGWWFRGVPEGSRAEQTQERVWIHATDSCRCKTRDVAGDVEHDDEGNRWFRPKRLREHKFYLCTICAYLYDCDGWFKELLSKRASGIAGQE